LLFIICTSTVFTFEIERRHKRHRSHRSRKHKSKNGMVNVGKFMGSFALEVIGIGDDFKTCFEGVTGTDDSSNVESEANAAAPSSDVKTFFQGLVSVIEFICGVKDKLVEALSAGKMFRRRHKHRRARKMMLFVEKRRRLTRAERKRLFDELVSWVREKATKVKEAIVNAAGAVKDKITQYITVIKDKIKAAYNAVKTWAAAMWEKAKSWMAKAKTWIEKYNTVQSCYNAAGTVIGGVSSAVKDGVKKLVEWFTNIASRITAITAAFAGSPKDILVVVVGIICAIPHIVKIVEYYQAGGDAWVKWGKIVARAGMAFTA